MASATSAPTPLPVHLALCLGGDAIERFQPLLSNLVVGLVDEAVDIRLVSDDDRVQALALGPTKTVRHMPVRWPFVSQRIDSVLEELQEKPPTIVHALTRHSHRTAWAVSEAFDSDLVVSVTSQEDVERLADMDLARVQRFVALSEPLCKVVLSQLSVSSERVETVVPGVRTGDRLHCFDPERTVATLICTAPFDRTGGVGELILAVDHLLTQGREIMLFLLGDGKQQSILRKIVRERNLFSQVTFAHPTGDHREALQAADIFVAPSVESTFSIDALQAMASGLAIVAVPNSVSNYYRHEENVLLCEPGKSSSLSAAIARILDDREFARKIGAGGIEYVKAHHTASGMVSRMVEVYRGLALNRATFSIKE